MLPLVGRGERGQALSDGQEELDVVVGETEVQLLNGNLRKGRVDRIMGKRRQTMGKRRQTMGFTNIGNFDDYSGTRLKGHP